MAEKDLVVVNSDGPRIGDVIPKQRALQRTRVGFPACKVGHEVEQHGMFAQVLRVPLLAVGVEREGDKVGRLVLVLLVVIVDKLVYAPDAYPREVRRVFCCVEDAKHGFCAIF